jgi:O-acetylserine/cysteine efflux transporter
MKDTLSPLVLIGTALVVTALWGFNFVVIAVGVREVPPLLLACLRFVVAALPVFFIRRPRVSWLLLTVYGLFLGVGQFGLLFTAIKVGAPAGISSIILQAQAFFTALLAVAFLREKFRWNHAVGLVVAGSGLVLMGWTKTAAGAWSVPWFALVMLLAAALMWAAANILARKMGSVDALGVIVWSSLIPPLPLLALSWCLEGGPAVTAALSHLSLLSWGAVAYLAFLSTLVGYGLWNWLIGRRGASAVAPFSLLVPVFGVTSAWLVLGESLTAGHLAAAGLILAGLVIHVFGGLFPGSRKETIRSTT